MQKTVGGIDQKRTKTGQPANGLDMTAKTQTMAPTYPRLRISAAIGTHPKYQTKSGTSTASGRPLGAERTANGLKRKTKAGWTGAHPKAMVKSKTLTPDGGLIIVGTTTNG